MSSLSRSFRQAHKSGAYVYAQVEESHLGQASVRLGTNGAGPRLSNLAILGAAVIPGQTVIVDYSTSTPKIRPLTTAFVEDEEELELAIAVKPDDDDPPKDPSGNYVLSIYGTDAQGIGSDWTEIAFSGEKFDTGALFDGSQVKITTPGFYFFLAHVQVQGFPLLTGLLSWTAVSLYRCVSRDSLDAFNIANSQCYAEIQLVSDQQGAFGWGAAYSVDTGPNYPTMLEAFGYINAKADEIITVEVRSQYGSLSSQVVSQTYPRLVGHRMNRDGFVSDGEAAASSTSDDQQYPPAIDDSDIELQGNRGYLHVSDTEHAYARAIAHNSNIADCELLVKFRFTDTAAGAYLRFWLRGTRNWDDWDKPYSGYEVAIDSSGGWYLAKIYQGERTILTSVNRSASDLQHYLRFQTNGNNIKAKIWLVSDSEPGWQIETTDAPSLSAGALQVGLFRIGGEHWAEIDDVNLHTP